MISNRIIVIGGDHHNTLGVIESLGRKGIRSYVLVFSNQEHAYVFHSKYVIEGWCCKDETSLVTTLLSNFSNGNNKSVIIATNDIVADIVDRHHADLKEYFYLPTTLPEGTLSKCMSKEFMSNLARQVGLDVPQTWIISDGVIPNNIKYPVITKAISSVVGTKENIAICYNMEELMCFLSKDHAPVIQAQRFIEKAFEFQLLGCSFNSGEYVYIPGRTHIDRPNGMDNTFFLRFDKLEPEFDDTVNKAIEFVKQTKYSGPFSIEFLKDRNDGKNYFTEMNFRNDGNAICVTEAGANIPFMYYLSLVGGDYKSEIKNAIIHPVYLCPDVYYFSCLLSREFGVKEWLSNMRKTTCYTTYFKNDRKPFFWFVWYALRKRLLHK